MTRWILDPAGALDSPHAGGKARALARAERGGLSVPAWIVLSDSAFFDALTAGQRAALHSDPSSVARIIAAVSMSDAVRSTVDAAIRALCPDGECLAVRSSAIDEDGESCSFAGQLESFLDVAPGDAPDRVLAVWRSAFSDRVLAYCREHGLVFAPRPPAVILQRMVTPQAAGVAFSADPVSGRRGVAVVSAVRGYGDALVAGLADADTWRVDRSGEILQRTVVGQPASAVLSDDQVRAVAALARQAARLFGRPQDIEWAIADRLVLLQSRPVTSIRTMSDPDGVPGHLGQQQHRRELQRRHDAADVFLRARDLPAGLPTVLPDDGRARARDRGARRHVPERARPRPRPPLLQPAELVPHPGAAARVSAQPPVHGTDDGRRGASARRPGGRDRTPDEARMAGRYRTHHAHAGGSAGEPLLAEHGVSRPSTDGSRRALAPPAPPLEDRRPDELAAHYRDLRSRLLLNWDAPLVNDFFAMVFYGLLRQLVIRWCGDTGGTLQNDLIGGEGGMVSAEPAVLLQRLARLAARDSALVHRLSVGSAEAIRADLEHHREILEGCQEYLAKFGDRTVNELKLESASLHDDPLPLFRAIASLASQIASARTDSETASSSSGDWLRGQAPRARLARAGGPSRPATRIRLGSRARAPPRPRPREPATRTNPPVRPRPADLSRARAAAARDGPAGRCARRAVPRGG